jgi:hypothetical protein
MSARMDPKVRRLVATIVVCGAALAVDKLVIGPPASADAATGGAAPTAPTAATTTATASRGAATPTAANAPPAPADPGAAPRDPRVVLARRLSALDGDDAGTPPDVVAAFGDPDRWWEPASPEETTDPDAARAAFRERFAREARLTAVLHSDDGLGGARINGRFVPLGGVIDGFRLVAIGARSAVLAGSAGRVVLEMSPPVVGGSPASAPARPGSG